MNLTPLHLRDETSPLDSVFALQNKATPELFPWMQAFVRNMGRGPTAAEIYGAANFYQAGGITRLCKALEEVGRRSAAIRERAGH